MADIERLEFVMTFFFFLSGVTRKSKFRGWGLISRRKYHKRYHLGSENYAWELTLLCEKLVGKKNENESSCLHYKNCIL